MSKVVNFEYFDVVDEAHAIKLVSFPIERKPIFFNDDNKIVPIDREVLFRSDTGFQFEIVSQGYNILKHEDALKTATAGLRNLNLPFKILNIGLDRDGAKMFARFQIEKDYSSGLRPELILLNSYDGGMALGLDLGAAKEMTQFHALEQARWPHLGSFGTINLEKEIKGALKAFDETIHPRYLAMSKENLTQAECLNTIAAAIKQNAIPQKLGPILTQKIIDNRTDNLWALYSIYAEVISGMKVSPTRKRELLQNVAKAFKDDKLFPKQKIA